MTLAAPAIAKATVWYHGGPKIRPGSVMSWDRDRGKSDLNAEGPGMYFTSSYDEANGYAHNHPRGMVYRGKLGPGFKLLPKKGPSIATLRALYQLASKDSKYTFLSNWNVELDDHTTEREIIGALTPYTREKSLHDAITTLYHDLYQYDANEYVTSLSTLGFDGVALDKGVIDGHRRLHLVVWNPGAMRLEEA